jgi:quercetin dioxygenase-like cupin family protein
MKHWASTDLLRPAQDARFRRLVLRAGRLRAASLSFAPGDSVPEHFHPGSDEVFFVVAGAGAISGGDEVREVVAGDLVYVPAGEPHALLARGDSEPFVLFAVVAPDLGDDSVLTDRPLPIDR